MTQPSIVHRTSHVCIVRHSFYPSELNVRREAEALREDGYRVHVVCLRNRGEPAHERVDDIDVHRMPIGHRRGNIGRYLFEYNAFLAAALLELIKLHRRHRLRAVQVNTMPDYLVFCTLPLRAAGVKVILHMHEPMPELFGTLFDRLRHGPLQIAIKVTQRFSVAYADRVLTVTEEMRQNIGQGGGDLGKITVILNVPDDRTFHPERYSHLEESVARVKEVDRRTGVFRLLCHGTIEPRYGLDLVVGAVARLKNMIPGIQFRLMGQGEFLSTVLARAGELGVSSNVHYLGFVPFETMIEEILCADVTIVPMRRNPYSILVHTNKMYEYMALERPIIASRLESVVSYFPDDTLLYFEPDDEADLADKALHVYNHPQEARVRVRHTTELYQKYRWEHEKRKYLGVYDALLGDAERRS